MKFIIPIVMALFPFLHDTSYNVEVQSCERDHIVVKSEGEQLSIQLFNLKMSDEEAGWARTCALLDTAHKVSMEIDSSSAIDDPLSVYLFADGALIQEELIRENLAYSLIHNPEYTYETQLQKVVTSNQVMANPQEHTSTSYVRYGWMFLLILYIIWSSCITSLVYKNRKFIIKNTRQKK